MKKSEFHARVQAIRERNARQDDDCMEILTMLAILAALFIVTF
jgi:hypothetical protein